MKKGVCKYFNGIQNDECMKAINYHKLVGVDKTGWVKKFPCFKSHKTTIVCNEMTMPTDDEVKRYDEDFISWFEKLSITLETIPDLKAKHPDGGSGQIECPSCKGTLNYSIARANKHIHMKCDTDGCISMME